jgi:hypothetical protein
VPSGRKNDRRGQSALRRNDCQTALTSTLASFAKERGGHMANTPKVAFVACSRHMALLAALGSSSRTRVTNCDRTSGQGRSRARRLGRNSRAPASNATVHMKPMRASALILPFEPPTMQGDAEGKCCCCSQEPEQKHKRSRGWHRDHQRRSPPRVVAFFAHSRVTIHVVIHCRLHCYFSVERSGPASRSLTCSPVIVSSIRSGRCTNRSIGIATVRGPMPRGRSSSAIRTAWPWTSLPKLEILPAG